MARTGLRMMPTFPSSPLRFRTAGFPSVRLQGRPFRRRLPKLPAGQACSRHTLWVVWFASVLRALRGGKAPASKAADFHSVKHHRSNDLCRSTPGALAPVRVIVSRSIITYSAPSAPLAGTPRLRRARFIRGALAVRERLGDLRVVPHFRCSLLLSMSPPMSPESSSLSFPVLTTTLAFTLLQMVPRSRLHFRGLLVHLCYDLLIC